MTKETTARSVAQRTAHAMRAAAIRLAWERVGQDTDPAQTYGCVDWFRYDASSPRQEERTAPPGAALRRGAGRGGASPAH
jgi:hypothetical protein